MAAHGTGGALQALYTAGGDPRYHGVLQVVGMLAGGGYRFRTRGAALSAGILRLAILAAGRLREGFIRIAPGMVLWIEGQLLRNILAAHLALVYKCAGGGTGGRDFRYCFAGF